MCLEEKFALSKVIDEKSAEIEDLTVTLREYHEQLNSLKTQNAHKSLIAERENWRKLVDNLRHEKDLLAQENDQLRDQIKMLSSPNPQDQENYTESKQYDAENGSDSSGSFLKNVPDISEVERLREDLHRKDLAIDALK